MNRWKCDDCLVNYIVSDPPQAGNKRSTEMTRCHCGLQHWTGWKNIEGRGKTPILGVTEEEVERHTGSKSWSQDQTSPTRS